MKIENINYYYDGIINKNKVVLAQAITLVESLNPIHEKLAAELLKKIIPLLGHSKKIAITGSPGSGKSTLIENFAYHLTQKNYSVAVLAIDPTSQITGGSILGDKTRMNKLSQSENAFIRPSPSKKGIGINPRSREVMMILDAFKFDFIFIETVGVGQTEIEVKSLVDCFTFIQNPTAGDELQGIKRGIMEVSDIIVINKADQDLETLANHFKSEVVSALSILRPSDLVPVILFSSKTQKGFSDLENSYAQFFAKKNLNTNFKDWLKEKALETFINELESNPKIQESLENQANLLKTGQLDILQAVSKVLKSS